MIQYIPDRDRSQCSSFVGEEESNIHLKVSSCAGATFVWRSLKDLNQRLLSSGFSNAIDSLSLAKLDSLFDNSLMFSDNCVVTVTSTEGKSRVVLGMSCKGVSTGFASGFT